MSDQFLISRRKILQGGGAVLVSFSLHPAFEANAQATASMKPVAPTEVDSFLAIDAKGLVTVYSGKVDIGTGLRTALLQIVAEELDLPFQSVTIIQGDTSLTPDQGPSSGSNSIQIGGVQLRQAAAAAKGALLKQAASRLGMRSEDLKTANGVISASDGQTVTYAELVSGKMFSITLDPKKPMATKPPQDFSLVGQPVQRIDIPDKITGCYTYMQDFRVPGMLHGRVIRPPALGSELQSVDEDSVKGVPGVVKIVRQGSFLGVVATTEWMAIKAAQTLKASWSKSEELPEQEDLFGYVRASKIAKDDITSNVGDTAAALSGAGVKRVEATYDFAIHTHGSIGPSCAIASFDGGKLTSWSASQATHNLRKQFAQMFKMPLDDINCNFIEGSGCYGRNGHEDAAADAALLAKAVGKPVRVQWSRADEHGWDPKGPPTLVDLRAGIDGSGNVVSWEGEFFIPEQRPPTQLFVPLLSASLAGMPDGSEVGTGGINGNSNIPYKFPNIKTTCHRLKSTPLRPSWIRSPGRMQNTFANECFIDELAALAKIDPVEFRLKHLDDARGIEVLKRAAALAKWETRISPKANQNADVQAGRGVAYCKYEMVRTYVAAVAEVELTRSTGEIRVTKFFIAHDCGQIINPDGLKNQLDGSTLQTISRTLKEEVKFDRSAVTSLDWVSYPILTFPEIPEIAYDLIDRPDEPPWGGGEPSAAVVPSAISNAIFDAAGVRLRSVPFTPGKVQAALHHGT
jgi:CO/xanthine dehydrogenase Mo-binding subunit